MSLPNDKCQYGSDRENVAKSRHSKDAGKTENYQNKTSKYEELNETGTEREVYDARSA